MNQSEVLVQESFQDKFLCKARTGNREREWRLLKTVTNIPAEEDLWYEDISFPSHEVKAVYLGAAMANDKKLELNKLLLRKFPKVKVFQAKPLSDRFELDFERLNTV